MAPVKHLIIYYHNHHPQKQCTDMATHALEQMSLTVTTPHPSLSPSLSKPHPPSVVNAIHSLCPGDSCTMSPILTCICVCNALTPTLFAFTFTCMPTIISRFAVFTCLCSHASDVHIPCHQFLHAFAHAMLSHPLVHTHIHFAC